jgi:NADH:ubiquinone oxidoreductase subunit 2 (subunit N)
MEIYIFFIQYFRHVADLFLPYYYNFMFVLTPHLNPLISLVTPYYSKFIYVCSHYFNPVIVAEIDGVFMGMDHFNLFIFLFFFGYLTFFIILLLILGIFSLNKHISYPNFKSSLYGSIIYFLIIFAYILSYNDTIFYTYLDNLNIFDIFFYITSKYIYIYFVAVLGVTRYYTLYKHMNMLEYYMLILSILLATFCLISSIDFVSIFLSLEILSLTSYILVAYARNSIFSLEGGVKYFVIGSLASAFFLIGSSIFFAKCGSTNLYKISLLLSSSE